MVMKRKDVTEIKHSTLSIPDVKGLAWSMKYKVMILSKIIKSERIRYRFDDSNLV